VKTIKACLSCVLLLAALFLGHAASAQISDQWLLTINHSGERLGILTVEGSGNAQQAYVDGGPIAMTVHGNAITMTMDYRDGGGRLLSREITGTIDGNRMSGTLTAPHDGSTGTWRAEPWAGATDNAPPAPVDLTGIWSRISAGTEKVHLDYTAAAQARVDAYHYLDDPALRCISPGLVRLSGWPYPLEIMQNDKQVVILYESFHEVRRIFTDGRDFPNDLPATGMGYSIGHWEGDTLVVETRQLRPNFVDLAGQPLSGDAVVTEYISLSEDGNVLRSLLSLEDPAFYQRPITRFRQWRRTPETAILEYDCDPYPFFRGLEIEGTLQDYWQRMRQAARNR